MTICDIPIHCKSELQGLWTYWTYQQGSCYYMYSYACLTSAFATRDSTFSRLTKTFCELSGTP
jgi:hypothetical protein